MKLKNVIQTKLAKTLVAALMIGSISNTGFTVQAEEATQNEQNDVVEMASVSGNDSSCCRGREILSHHQNGDSCWRHHGKICGRTGSQPQRMAQ